MVVWVSPRSTTVGVHPGFHNRRQHIAAKIRSLLNSLTKVPSEYDKNRPKIEYWIEYVLRERFVTVDELVEDVSCVAWEQGGSFASVGRFLKEFYDTPRRSEQARSFVDKLCEHVLRWFAIAAVEDSYPTNATIASGDGPGFMRAASFVGYLVEWGLLSDELVRRHLIKPLITHNDDNNSHRANAIYQLFIVAGSTLLRGLLESEDIQLCFDTLDVSINRGYVAGLNAGKLQVKFTSRSDTSHRILTRLLRNFARSILGGWKRKRRQRIRVTRRQMDVWEKRKRRRWLQRSKHPSLSFLGIFLALGLTLTYLPPHCKGLNPLPFCATYGRPPKPPRVSQKPQSPPPR